MSTIQIRVAVNGSQPDRDRLARADRYVEIARQQIDTRSRDAYFDEADRIYREEGIR